MTRETAMGDGAAVRPQSSVRAARDEDLPAVLRLLEQLGYEAESPRVPNTTSWLPWPMMKCSD